jgi:nucleotide-binding universal stress UspA family protein
MVSKIIPPSYQIRYRHESCNASGGIKKAKEMSMKTILILTDFSEAAQHATEFACQIAGALQAKRVLLYHAYRTIIGGTEIPVTVDSKQIYDENMQKLGMLREGLEARLGGQTKIDIGTEDAFLYDRINPFCAQQEVDLIVMGMSGKSQVQRLLIGSTVMEVLDVSDFPVLVVPKLAPVDAGIKNLILTTDLKEFSLPAYPLMRELMDAFAPNLHVLHVQTEDEVNKTPENQSVASRLQELLDQYNPSFKYLSGEDIENSILSFSKLYPSPLIVAVHRKRNFLSALFHHSVSKRLSYDSPAPLLALPSST